MGMVKDCENCGRERHSKECGYCVIRCFDGNRITDPSEWIPSNGVPTEKLEPMREKLIDLLTDVFGMSIGFKADHLIENGVTIPVRCKDCAKTWCYLRQELGADGYCSGGERRTDADRN